MKAGDTVEMSDGKRGTLVAAMHGTGENTAWRVAVEGNVVGTVQRNMRLVVETNDADEALQSEDSGAQSDEAAEADEAADVEEETGVTVQSTTSPNPATGGGQAS